MKSRWLYHPLVWGLALALTALPAGADQPSPDPSPSDEVSALRAEVAALRAHLEALEARLEELASTATPATPTGSPGDSASLEAQLAAELGGPAPATTPAPAPIVLAGGGGKNFLNLSLDALMVGGTSTTPDVAAIETGGHDPSGRGFTIQNVEAVLEGAVDPYFRGQANLIYQLDAEGETQVELEEAYLTSTSLPHNLQLKAGQFFTEFGRLNAQHPHTWDFVDQPLVNGRLLGGDGLRGPGARLSWLAPTKFYSELFLTLQSPRGETAASFLATPGEELFGRTLIERRLRSPGDLVISPRYTASFDLSDTQSLLLGASGAFGPNGSGRDTRTEIYGIDAFYKWKPNDAEAGFPFVKWQTEAMTRRYEASAVPAIDPLPTSADFLLPAETLRDHGAYSQVLWGFRRGWVAGLRGDWVGGSRAALDSDPARSTHWRASTNLTWFPTEFSKFRLQFNQDHLEDQGNEFSVWLQMEFILGAHAAHKF